MVSWGERTHGQLSSNTSLTYIRCSLEPNGGLYQQFGYQLQRTLACAPFCNLAAFLWPPFKSARTFPWASFSPFPQPLFLRPDCPSFLEISRGHCLNTDFTGSCSMSTIIYQIIPSCWWFTSCYTAFTTTCLWISEFVDWLTKSPPDFLFTGYDSSCHLLYSSFSLSQWHDLLTPCSRLLFRMGRFPGPSYSVSFVPILLCVTWPRTRRCYLWFNALRVRPFRLHICVFLTLFSFQHASHQTSGISSRAEKVSFSSPLQKFRARLWCHQYGSSTSYYVSSNAYSR